MITEKKRHDPACELQGAANIPLGAEILDQRAFTRMLCYERKRAERSGRPFVLMLLEPSDSILVGRRDQTLHKAQQTLVTSARETDLKGWYKDALVAGVIFTEIGGGDGLAAIRALSARVTSALRATMTLDEVDCLRLSFHVFPDYADSETEPAGANLALYPDHGWTVKESKRISRLLKRALDLFGAFAALLLLSPVLAAIALAIKTTARGPVLFRQERIGRHGTRFTFLEFRSMNVASDQTLHQEFVKQLITGNAPRSAPGGLGQRPVFKLTHDPRVTRVGRLLRRTSLDELPQLLNVIHGDMSLVGPRPPIPYEYAFYSAWHRRRLLAVKPGITGLWQVRGRSRVSFDEMVRLDLKYAETWSLWLDIKILLLTPAAVLSGDGAY